MKLPDLSPRQWRDRAEEAHVQADQMRDPVARRMLLAIAENYDQLAEQIEARIRSGVPPNLADANAFDRAARKAQLRGAAAILPPGLRPRPPVSR
jgi:hypothetical protein